MKTSNKHTATEREINAEMQKFFTGKKHNMADEAGGGGGGGENKIHWKLMNAFPALGKPS